MPDSPWINHFPDFVVSAGILPAVACVSPAASDDAKGVAPYFAPKE
jgi:hypothetical protein